MNNKTETNLNETSKDGKFFLAINFQLTKKILPKTKELYKSLN